MAWLSFHLIIASLVAFSWKSRGGGAAVSAAADHLQFLAIGDWGKGGVNGDITTTFSSVELGPSVEYQQDSLEQEEGPEEERSGGIGSILNVKGGGGGQKKTYTYQVAIAGAMSRWVSEHEVKPEFILSLGDNFYDNGVLSATDTPWTTHWKNVYLQNHTNLRVPWYPIFGNHDYGYGQQGLQAQMDRSETDDYTSNLWQFPSTNYSKLFPIPGGGMVGVVFVDTTTLAPSQNKCCNENGGVSQEEQQIRIKNQISHLHTLFQDITQNNLTWLLVAGHYPIFSRGEHGDMSELIENLLPLLIQYNVSLYICGHDHISEHLQAHGIEFFVSGAGSMTSYLYKNSEASYLWSGTGYSAFTSFQAYRENLTVTYVRYDNTVVYNYTLWSNHTYEDQDQIDDDEDTRGDDDQIDIFQDRLLDDHMLKVLGIAGVLVSALILVGIAFFLSKRQPSQSPILSPPSSRSDPSLAPRPTLPRKKTHHQREKKKQPQPFHSLLLNDYDDQGREDEKLLQLGQCTQEKKCLTSSLHSPRPSSSAAATLSLPYPRGVATHSTTASDRRLHKKIKSMPSVSSSSHQEMFLSAK